MFTFLNKLILRQISILPWKREFWCSFRKHHLNIPRSQRLKVRHLLKPHTPGLFLGEMLRARRENELWWEGWIPHNRQDSLPPLWVPQTPLLSQLPRTRSGQQHTCKAIVSLSSHPGWQSQPLCGSPRMLTPCDRQWCGWGGEVWSRRKSLPAALWTQRMRFSSFAPYVLAPGHLWLQQPWPWRGLPGGGGNRTKHS